MKNKVREKRQELEHLIYLRLLEHFGSDWKKEENNSFSINPRHPSVTFGIEDVWMLMAQPKTDEICLTVERYPKKIFNFTYGYRWRILEFNQYEHSLGDINEVLFGLADRWLTHKPLISMIDKMYREGEKKSKSKEAEYKSTILTYDKIIDRLKQMEKK